MTAVLLPETINEDDVGHISAHEELHVWHNTWRLADNSRLYLPSDFVSVSALGVPGGVATLDALGKVEQDPASGTSTGGGGDVTTAQLTTAIAAITLDSLSDVSPGPGADETGEVLGLGGFGYVHVAPPAPSLELLGAHCDAKAVYAGATVNTGSPTLTIASGQDTFNPAHAGQTVLISNPAGGASFQTTLLTYVSATQFTMAANSTITTGVGDVFWGTDDTLQVQAAINGSPARGATWMVPRPTLCTGNVNSQGRRQITFVGRGGKIGRNERSVAGLISFLPTSALITTQASGTFLNFDETKNCRFENVALLAADRAFTGTVLSMRGNAADTNARTERLTLRGVTVGAASNGGGGTGSKAIDHTRAWKPVYDDCIIHGTDLGICCDNGTFVNGPAAFGCEWLYQRTCGIRNPGEGFSIHGGHVYRLWNGGSIPPVSGATPAPGCFIDCGDGSGVIDALSIFGTWFSDVGQSGTGTNPAASAWLKLLMTNGYGGVGIYAPRVGGGQNNQVLVEILGNGVAGLHIVGGSYQYGSSGAHGAIVKTNGHTGLTGVIDSRTMALGANMDVLVGAAGGLTVL